MAEDGRQVVVALGSNQGDRLTYLEKGFEALQELAVGGMRRSEILETTAIDCPEPLPFLNAVATFRTILNPHQMLEHLLAIERSHGRQRRYPNAPRTLDLDLLYWDQQVIDEPNLQVPHPSLHLRHFVLIPLCQVCPDWVHPILGKSSMRLLEELQQSGKLVDQVFSIPLIGLPTTTGFKEP